MSRGIEEYKIMIEFKINRSCPYRWQCDPMGRRFRHSGVALVLVLCFVVLLTSVVLVFLYRSLSNGLISQTSTNSTITEIYSHGAIEQIIGDLRQEISAGSTSLQIYTDSAGTVHHIYRPKIVAAATPSLSGPPAYGIPTASGSAWNATFPNLIKESVYSVPFYSANFDSNYPQRAAQVSTSSDPNRLSGTGSKIGPSLNGRSINISRWNKHLLLPKMSVTISGGSGGLPVAIIDNGTTDTTPAAQFLAPDWILTAADGANPATFDAATMTDSTQKSYIVGRYAYAIYNEGGLLDANVAGSPNVVGGTYPPSLLSASSSSNGGPSQQTIWSRKGPESFADLTQLPGFSNLSQTRQLAVLNSLLGWRNSATLQATLQNTSAGPSGGYNLGSIDNYFSSLLGLTTRFVTADNTPLNAMGLINQMFVSRQQMISFFQSLAQGTSEQAYLQDGMMYLTQYSRSLNQPSYWPDPGRPVVKTGNFIPPALSGNTAYNLDKQINPPFKSVVVTSPFTRNDGTIATVGEPLVKKRFALSRLCWITSKGPSASLSSSDPIYQQGLKNGIPAQLLSEGTVANIQNYFGLNWHAGTSASGLGGYWTYDLHVVPATGSTPTMIKTLQQVAAENPPREANFFELLQAAICCGSLGSGHYFGGSGYGGTLPGYLGPGNWQFLKDVQISLHVIQVGANIIEQAAPDAYPILIVYNDGAYMDPCWGQDDLPYFVGAVNLGVVVNDASPPAPGTLGDTITPGGGGLGVHFSTPVIWNPHSQNSALAPGLAPANLRISVSTASLDHPALEPSTLQNTSSANEINGALMQGSATTDPWAFGQINPATGCLQFGSADTSNTFIYFSNNASLYREPTPLLQWGLPTGSNVHLDQQNVIFELPNSSAWQSTGIPELNPPSPNKPIKFFVGFLHGEYPLRQKDPTTGEAANTYYLETGTTNNGITYLLEYQDPAGNWFPYQQYDRFPCYNYSENVPVTVAAGNPTPTVANFNTLSLLQGWAVSPTAAGGSPAWNIWETVDPRTNRWAQLSGYPLTSFIDPSTQTMIQSLRPSISAPIVNGEVATAASRNLVSESGCVPDPDGIVRRASGGYATIATTIGYPMATVVNAPANRNTSNRPIILHRPFQSVAELGYVFSDKPWKNLDFFSPESGDSALMDVFCINEDYRADAVSSGQVDLNSRQSPVFQALLAGAYRDELVPSNPNTTPISTTQATAMAQALIARTISTATGKGPLFNVADLVGRYVSGYSNSNQQPYDGFSADLGLTYSTQWNGIIQRFRESTMRALSDAGQAGTWNLLIDVIAQNGRYPATATGLADFLVEGERHYWVHVAIDRTTGDVIDENIEVVNE